MQKAYHYVLDNLGGCQSHIKQPPNHTGIHYQLTNYLISPPSPVHQQHWKLPNQQHIMKNQDKTPETCNYTYTMALQYTFKITHASF